MAITSLGDLASAFILRRQGAESKAQIQLLSAEMTTGLAGDRGRKLTGDLSPLAGIESSLIKLRGYKDAALSLGMTAGATQIALQNIGAQALETSGHLLSVTANTSENQMMIVSEDASRRMDAVVAAINTRFGDRSLFSGEATNQAAMISASDLLDLLQGVTAGVQGTVEAEALIAGWFADPAGFQAQAYLGAGPLDAIAITPEETARLDITAMDPTLLETLKAFALPALLSRGLMAGQPAAQADIMQRSGERLLELQSDWVNLSARLGMTEAQADTALSRNSAESSALELARLQLIGVDPFETATKLEAVQTQLETIYALTARMQRLNLADYL